MDEVYAWVEDQREENSRGFYRFLDEQRQIWTPSCIFNRCCVRWLADGKDTGGMDEYYDEYSYRNGCGGGCGREHPKIKLTFDRENRVTVATMSHALDPFRRYFAGRMARETARPRHGASYELDGYVRPNLTHLRSQSSFGSHLVVVRRGALEASDSTFAEEDEATRAAKRARVAEQPIFDRLEEVMNIAVSHRLREDLDPDPVSLYFMRQTCRVFRRLAVDIASQKMKSIELSLTPLVNGTEQFGEAKLDGYDSESWEADFDPYEDGGAYRYDKKEKMSFVYHNENHKEGGFRPAESAEFGWQSKWLHPDPEAEYGDREAGVDEYIGQKLRVYWHPHDDDIVQPTTRFDMYDQRLPTLGVLLAVFSIGGHPKEGIVTKTNGRGVSLEYEVLESAKEKKVIDEDKEENFDGDSNDDSENSKDGVVCLTRFTGRVRVNKLKLDFGALVRKHALEVIAKLRSEHEATKKERPLTSYEKEFFSRLTHVAG